MKIICAPDQVQIKFEEAHAGILDTSSRDSAVEYGEVISIAETLKGGVLKVGDKVFVKSWAVDHIYHNDKHYTFVDIKTGGIKAIVK